MDNSKRRFLKLASAYATSLGNRLPLKSDDSSDFRGELCFFSKHLPGMGWQRLSRTARELGFKGIDLTVRPGGHVLPERAIEDLPKAISAIRTEGLSVPMITTGLISATEIAAQPILSIAGKLGVSYFKPGYYKYELKDVRRELEKFGLQFSALAKLGQQSGLQCGFHNHEGNIGAPLWDVATIIDRLDPRWVGYYFDVRHAVVEGGGSGWKIATNLVAPRLKMIAVKDFFWEKSAKGWNVVNCPLGQGMVDWKQYFKILRQANFQGPVSLHLEYEISGATSAAKEENTILAAQRDLEFLKKQLQEAYR